MKDLFSKLLDYYSINEDDYKMLTREVDESNFINGHKFENIDKAISILEDSISNKDKIIIYGDYDADGIMGTSILYKMLKYKNYDFVNYYIPNRYIDGYGLNLTNAEKIAEKGYKLVICVDNGISAFEAIDYLKSKNIKVLVLDHHEIQNDVPNADMILHPFYSRYGTYSCSGAFVAFIFSIHFLKRFDKYLSTLAAISTVSDMMPLKEYNRDLLRLVFSKYTDGEFLQISLLKNDNDPFNEKTIGMQIAPKINSIGRMIDDSSINNIIKYFVSDNREEILTYFVWIDSTNNQRKEISKNCLSNLSIDSTNSAIVEIVDEKEGIIGLIANSCLDKYKKPSIIFAYDHISDSLKGSCRSLPGCNVTDAFASLSDILLNFGGHSLAGGCTIKKEKFEEFKTRFSDYVKSHPYQETYENGIDINIADINRENYKIVQKFGPFGEGWKEPLFNLFNIKSEALRFSRDGNHILTPIGINTKIVGFNISKEKLNEKNDVEIQGYLRESSYKGVTSLDFLISKLY